MLGAGNIGRTLAEGWARAGLDVRVGARDPGRAADQVAAPVVGLDEAVARGDTVVLAVPAPALDELVGEHADVWPGKVVVDATNRVGADVLNGRALFHRLDVQYCRAFSTVGWEVLADPVIGGVTADLFYCAPDPARAGIEQLITALGLRPVHLGDDGATEVVDGLTRVWFTLAFERGHGRRVALHAAGLG